jgi:hypothetical protein
LTTTVSASAESMPTGVPEQPRQLAADPGLNGIVCRPLRDDLGDLAVGVTDQRGAHAGFQGGDTSAWPGHAGHLVHRLVRIGEVLQEGLRPAGIEAAVVVRQVHRVTHAEHLPRPEE